jgi:hypothetical protein
VIKGRSAGVSQPVSDILRQNVIFMQDKEIRIAWNVVIEHFAKSLQAVKMAPVFVFFCSVIMF